MGSVFSPYYAAARRQGPANPEHFCALNVALYGAVPRWAMTERGAADVSRDVERFTIGPSQMRWDGDVLEVDINERCMPLPRKLRGRLRLQTPAPIDHAMVLNGEGMHLWRPYAPCTRVSLELEQPFLSWQGQGYFDSNCGHAALESGFSHWHWSRVMQGPDTLVIYDATRRDGSQIAFARHFSPSGDIADATLPPPANLPRGLWGVTRPTRAEHGSTPRLIRRLEDAPFYTRSEVALQIGGHECHGVHESLDLDRFSKRWVQTLLPFRMPRLAGRSRA